MKGAITAESKGLENGLPDSAAVYDSAVYDNDPCDAHKRPHRVYSMFTKCKQLITRMPTDRIAYIQIQYSLFSVWVYKIRTVYTTCLPGLGVLRAARHRPGDTGLRTYCGPCCS